MAQLPIIGDIIKGAPGVLYSFADIVRAFKGMPSSPASPPPQPPEMAQPAGALVGASAVPPMISPLGSPAPQMLRALPDVVRYANTMVPTIMTNSRDYRDELLRDHYSRRYQPARYIEEETEESEEIPRKSVIKDKKKKKKKKESA